jgi:hypothetical protein
MIRIRVAQLAGHPVSRIVAYYVVMAGVVWLSTRLIPGLQEALIWAPSTGGADQTDLFKSSSSTVLSLHPLRDLTLAMLGSFFIVVPVAWVYMLTKLQVGYDESVVHTMIILPLAVAGVVVLVQDSLPLAFSLAGIVAAVRFRSTLDDTKDAVYVFIAIAIGIAAGAQALSVALLMSLIFNAAILLLWRLNVGNVYSDRRVIGTTATQGELLAPAGGGPALAVGDTQLLAALSKGELADVANRLAHLEKHIAASGDNKRERFDAVFLVHVTGIEPAQRKIEPIFDEDTVNWRLAEITPGRDTTSTMEYLVRMREEVLPGRTLDRLREAGAPHVAAVEFKSLDGLVKKKKNK